MATILEREDLFYQNSKNAIVKATVRDLTKPDLPVAGWHGILQAVRHEALFGNPVNVFEKHTQMLGTGELLLRFPQIRERWSGDELTLMLVDQVLRQSKAFFDPKSGLAETKGPFAAQFNFMMDASSSEAIIRVLERMHGYPFNLSDYQQTVDEQCRKLSLPKPDIVKMSHLLINSYGRNVIAPFKQK